MNNVNIMDILKEKLKDTGFKITPQRRAIIERTTSNTRYAIRNLYGCDTRYVSKCVRKNTSYCVGNN